MIIAERTWFYIMKKQLKLTAEGLKQLEDELENLKTVVRKENAEKLKIALSFGDLSENSEYDEAKNDQAQTEARILEIEAMLKIAEVVDESEFSADAVNIGSTVKVKNLDKGTVKELKIVGSTEADPLKDKISDDSPIGKGLLGAKTGDKVEVETPRGIVTYKILEISK